MSTNGEIHWESTYVPGDDNAERRARLDEQIKTATATGDYALVAKLAQEAAEIGPSTSKGRVEKRNSGKTVGDHWQTLTQPEKREELLNWEIVASLEKYEGGSYAAATLVHKGFLDTA